MDHMLMRCRVMGLLRGLCLHVWLFLTIVVEVPILLVLCRLERAAALSPRRSDVFARRIIVKILATRIIQYFRICFRSHRIAVSVDICAPSSSHISQQHIATQ